MQTTSKLLPQTMIPLMAALLNLEINQRKFVILHLQDPSLLYPTQGALDQLLSNFKISNYKILTNPHHRSRTQ